MKKSAVFLSSALGLTLATSSFADNTTEELRATIKSQQEALKQLELRLDETEKRLEQTADAVDSSASKGSATTIGGYGELHYNHITNDKDGTAKKEFDFHRFVLFFGHEFTENTRFFSEVELEHALSGDGKPGEVELEQAYVEHDVNNMFSTKAGVFLIPVGILNETHEPPTFYGVERNPVEKNIIPATWWEGGAAITVKPMGGLAFDAAITSGLKTPTTGSNAYKIRKGRQKVANADGNDLAYTLRVKYTAVPGLELAATAQYQTDVTQNLQTLDIENEDGTTETLTFEKAPATLLSTHAIYNYEGFGLRALYAQWNIEGAEAEAAGRNEQYGFYLEPSYRINDAFGVFARYSKYDNTAGDKEDSKITQINTGVNYWLHENVVFKADYEIQGDTKDAQGFNLGVGYQF
ncbi:MAG: porin [Cellvibrionales bacterium]|nr:porin [Cellvibrionales bacterium]